MAEKVRLQLALRRACWGVINKGCINAVPIVLKTVLTSIVVGVAINDVAQNPVDIREASLHGRVKPIHRTLPSQDLPVIIDPLCHL